MESCQFPGLITDRKARRRAAAAAKDKAILQNKKQLGQTVTWPDVAESVLKSRPECASSGPSIFGFILRFGDGKLPYICFILLAVGYRHIHIYMYIYIYTCTYSVS